MAIDRLKIRNFRNLSEVSIALCPRFNVFTGANGAGKSSVLEAVHVLGTGKSFRSVHHKSLIRSGSRSLVVSGELSGSGSIIGIERSDDGRAVVAMDSVRLNAASELARQLPVMPISLSDFRLFEDGPRVRRRFLDWGVYHFFPDRAGTVFSRFRRALKQRNQLLKNDTISASERDFWTKEFIESGEALNRLRAQYMDELEQTFKQLCLEFQLVESFPDLKMELIEGWPLSQTLAQAIDSPRVQLQERRYRRSAVGPQRTELRFLTGSTQVGEILSRGQLKVLGHLLKLAQVRLLHTSQQSYEPVILLDDLTAELDKLNLHRMLVEIGRTGYQVFISTLTSDDMIECYAAGNKMPLRVFHVEHGDVKTVE